MSIHWPEILIHQGGQVRVHVSAGYRQLLKQNLWQVWIWNEGRSCLQVKKINIDSWNNMIIMKSLWRPIFLPINCYYLSVWMHLSLSGSNLYWLLGSFYPVLFASLVPIFRIIHNLVSLLTTRLVSQSSRIQGSTSKLKSGNSKKKGSK